MKKDAWSPNDGFPLLLAALLLAGSFVAAGLAEAAEAKPVKDLVRSAQLVFRGTVQEIGATNLSIVEPNAETALVRVDEVLKADGTLDDFTGHQVTVFLREAASAGDQHVFFTNVRLLGQSLGVQEVGRTNGSTAELVPRVRGAESEIAREALAARLETADLVVSGRVLSTRATASSGVGPITEHDPMWREAVLEVRSVLKGEDTTETVTFVYPSSIDVMWARVPKPSAGHDGTWLLYRHQPQAGASVYVVIDPEDLLSAAEEKLAARMVQP